MSWDFLNETDPKIRWEMFYNHFTGRKLYDDFPDFDNLHVEAREIIRKGAVEEYSIFLAAVDAADRPMKQKRGRPKKSPDVEEHDVIEYYSKNVKEARS